MMDRNFTFKSSPMGQSYLLVKEYPSCELVASEESPVKRAKTGPDFRRNKPRSPFVNKNGPPNANRFDSKIPFYSQPDRVPFLEFEKQ